MTGLSKALLVLPPPGPLVWLHPELAEFRAPPLSTSEGVLDLWERPLRGSELFDAVRSSGAARVIVDDGPWADATAAVLRQGLRHDAIAVTTRFVGRAPGLEGRLDAAAVRGDPRLCPIDPIDPIDRGDGLDGRLAALLARARSAAAGAGAPRPIPYFRGLAAGTAPVETRCARSFFGILPGDAYPATVRARMHDLVGLLHPERLAMFRDLENLAVAGFDVYREQLLRDAVEAPAGAAAPSRVIAITGIDGSGKSSHVAALSSWLVARGLSVAVHKIYRHGVFHDTVTDLTRSCGGDRNLHLWRIERTAKLFDSVKYFGSAVAPDLGRKDVLLFDRYLDTHEAAFAGRSLHDPYGREILSVFPRADRTFLLDVPSETALARIESRSRKTVDENPYMLDRYRTLLLRIARRDGATVLDARRPFDENQAAIRAEVGAWLHRRGGDA